MQHNEILNRAIKDIEGLSKIALNCGAIRHKEHFDETVKQLGELSNAIDTLAASLAQSVER